VPEDIAPPREPAMSLCGLRILDLSRILAGPTCTQFLGDLGADVVKVERPGAGDDTRSWGPPFTPPAPGHDAGFSAYFLCANRNKRSIAIDMTTEAGAGLIRRLAAGADAVVENYKPGDLARRGLAYDDLKALNPGLVWCSITGFGQTGPYAERPGYDFLIQAMGGVMSVTGEPEEEGGEPMKVGVAVADVVCGLYAAAGILAALRHRDRTGEGQMIDLSLFDTQVSWLVNLATNYLVSGERPQRRGNRHPNIVPYQSFRASDGYLCLAVGNDRQFEALCRVAGCTGLPRDPRFATNPSRVRHREALEAILVPLIETRAVATWTEALTAAGVPAGPVQSIDEVLASPQTEARGMVIAMESEAAAGALQLVANPVKLSATPPRYRHPPPELGADCRKVLEDWLGLDDAAIRELASAGAFGAGAATRP
jgi:crotonobetainyl-CoA:carnitine CoA-transferase CaiB-like acyl-CoA transferase